MRLGITQRLLVSLLAATWLTVGCLFLVAHWSLGRGFREYLVALDRERLEDVAKKVESLYADRGSLALLKGQPRRWAAYLVYSQPGEEPPAELFGPPRPAAPRPPPPTTNRPERRLVVLDDARDTLIAPAEGSSGAALRPVLHRGRAVAYVGMLPPKNFLDPLQTQFVSQQKLALVLAAAGVVLAALAFSLPLARRLVRPLRELAAATRRLAAGEYATRVRVGSSDELGQLARDFNAMATALEKNEELRRRWVADISHELRTPLAVLRGEIEALLDGIRDTTPETILSLHAEVLRLGRLVDDLYQLSLSDVGALTYRKAELALSPLLERALDLFRPEFARKEIAVALHLPAGEGPQVKADPQRLAQLFANLLENSVKHTEAGGRLEVRLDQGEGACRLDFEDSAPGVPEPELDRLFERLYRVEGSRSRESGGAGLGLAIARTIVAAHGGEISARPSRLGGLWVRVVLPTVGGG